MSLLSVHILGNFLLVRPVHAVSGVRSWYISQINQVDYDRDDRIMNYYTILFISYGFDEVVFIVSMNCFSCEKHFPLSVPVRCL